MRIRVLLSLAVLASTALAAQDQPSRFVDKEGNMSLENVGPWQLRFPSRSTAGFRAAGFKGGKLTGKWKGQGLTIVTTNLTGSAAVSGSSLTLKSATMEGGFTLTSTQGESVTTINGTSADYDAAKNEVETKSAVTINQKDNTRGTTMVAKGAGAKVNLNQMENGPLKGVSELTLAGPVTMTITGQREDEDPKTKKPRKLPFRLDAKGNKLVYTASNREITLTGNVVVNGDDPVFGGDIRANRAVFVLTAAGEVESIDLDGPGETEFRKQGGG